MWLHDDTTTSAASARSETGSFPWTLFIFTWPALYWLHNEIDAPLHPYEAQSLSDVVQVAETGNIVARILIVILGIIGISLMVRYRGRIQIASRIAPLAFAFILWVVMTGLWSTDSALSIRRLVSLLLITMFSAGCALRMNTRSLLVFIASIPIVSLLPGVVSETHYGIFTPWSSGYRFGGTAPHPNVEAATLAVSCLLLCWQCWRARGAARVGGLLALFIAGSFLVLTGSRTAIISLSVALGFSVALVLFRDYKRALPAVLACLCLMVGLYSLFSVLSSNAPELPSRGALQAQRDEGSGNTLNGRVDLWKSLLVYVSKRPLRGYGYGSFWTPRRIEDVSGDQGWTIQQSHSAYLDELLALGIPGAALYVALLLSCLIRSILQFLRHRDGYGAWGSVFVFILFHDLTESININSGYTYLVFSILVMHLALVRLDPPSEDPTKNLVVEFRPALLRA